MLEKLARRSAICLLDELGDGKLTGAVDGDEQAKLAFGILHTTFEPQERLRRKMIRIVSITQNFGDDPASDMAVAMLAIFDEYPSAENGKPVRRTMIANAANSF